MVEEDRAVNHLFFDEVHFSVDWFTVVPRIPGGEWLRYERNGIKADGFRFLRFS